MIFAGALDVEFASGLFVAAVILVVCFSSSVTAFIVVCGMVVAVVLSCDKVVVSGFVVTISPAISGSVVVTAA